MTGGEVSKGGRADHDTPCTDLGMCAHCNGKHLNYFNCAGNKISLVNHQKIYTFPTGLLLASSVVTLSKCFVKPKALIK